MRYCSKCNRYEKDNIVNCPVCSTPMVMIQQDMYGNSVKMKKTGTLKVQALGSIAICLATIFCCLNVVMNYLNVILDDGNFKVGFLKTYYFDAQFNSHFGDLISFNSIFLLVVVIILISFRDLRLLIIPLIIYSIIDIVYIIYGIKIMWVHLIPIITIMIATIYVLVKGVEKSMVLYETIRLAITFYVAVNLLIYGRYEYEISFEYINISHITTMIIPFVIYYFVGLSIRNAEPQIAD